MKLSKKILAKLVQGIFKPLQTSADKEPAKIAFEEWIARINRQPGLRVLEVGSRNVTGTIRRDTFPDPAEYVGMDVREGPNVDVVGDVHRLSELVPNDHFDVVYSAAVFEHLMFPWKAAMEINKVLKTGGHVFTITNPAWPEHEMPWDFWRFPKNGFDALFNATTGFENLMSEEGMAMWNFSMTTEPGMQKIHTRPINAVVFNVARKTGPYDHERLRWDLRPEDVKGDMYPAPNPKAHWTPTDT